MRHAALLVCVIGLACYGGSPSSGGAVSLHPHIYTNECDSSHGQGHNSDPNPSAPDKDALICIDAAFSTVNPDSVTVKSNHKAKFYVVGDAADLDVQFTPTTPVQFAFHNGNQHAAHYWVEAKAVPAKTAGDKYSVIDRATWKHIDPIIIIDP